MEPDFVAAPLAVIMVIRMAPVIVIQSGNRFIWNPPLTHLAQCNISQCQSLPAHALFRPPDDFCHDLAMLLKRVIHPGNGGYLFLSSVERFRVELTDARCVSS